MSWTIEGFGLAGPCLITGGSRLEELLDQFKPGGRVLVIVEERVALFHGHTLPGSYPRLVLPSLGEGLKHQSWLNLLLNCFYAWNLTRSDWILVVGGGALSDLAGFAASVYKRGIKTALAPTTLLAQVDAAIGGKCGLNWRGVKNLLGNFSFPARVFCAADVLDTLPRRQLLAGMAEVYKYQLLQLGSDFSRFRAVGRKELVRVVEECCRYKDNLAALDPFDTGARRVLNLGHTLAHALESLDQGMLHGEAVAWGLEYALRVAARRGFVSAVDLQAVLGVLGGMPRRKLPRLEFARVYGKMTRDKKNSFGQVSMILPGPGGQYQLFTCIRKELEENWNALVNT